MNETENVLSGNPKEGGVQIAVVWKKLRRMKSNRIHAAQDGGINYQPDEQESVRRKKTAR